MIYKKYQHVEKYGSAETDGILKGEVSLFHKIDGTNSCVFLDSDGEIRCGSRKRELSLESDNAGFNRYILESDIKDKLLKLLKMLPKNAVVYGEWLIPVTLKTYNKDAWRHFYIFDIVSYDDDIDPETLLSDEKSRKVEHYMPYEDYAILCDQCKLNYIPRIAKLNNPTTEEVKAYLDKTTFLIEKGIGEGMVIKNYDYKNHFGRQTWAKVLTADFLDKKSGTRERKHGEKISGEYIYESKMINKYATPEFVSKEISKFKESNPEAFNPDGSFIMRNFSKLMGYINEEFIRDNIIIFVNENKQAEINFSRLRKLLELEVKEGLLGA